MGVVLISSVKYETKIKHYFIKQIIIIYSNIFDYNLLQKEYLNCMGNI